MRGERRVGFGLLRTGIVVATALATVAAGGVAEAPGAAGAGGCTGRWEILDSPSPGTIRNVLADVTSPSPADAWAVGVQTSVVGGRTTSTTLIERWDGSSWSVVPSPQMRGGTLSGVYAAGPEDVWAVGSVLTGLTESVPLILHFDGTAWATVPSPQIPFGNLFAVAGTSGDDVWAVGTVRSPAHLLVEHFDGTSWTVQPTPGIESDFVALEGVAARSPQDVWAVGYALGPDGRNRTLSLHHDGSGWSLVPTPPVGPEGGELYDVATVGAEGAWAVGRDTGPGGSEPLALAWDGTSWTVPAPAVGGPGQLNGVATGPGATALAVGSTAPAVGNPDTLSEAFTGRRWRVVPGPDAGDLGNRLWAAAVTPRATEAWAVGEHGFTGRAQTLVERICRSGGG